MYILICILLNNCSIPATERASYPESWIIFYQSKRHHIPTFNVCTYYFFHICHLLHSPQPSSTNNRYNIKKEWNL